MTIAALGPALLWLKALHVIAVIAWMAGVLYLPRLFVYHCEVARGSLESERFKVMERRLYRQIIIPAMLAAWVLGILLVLTPGRRRLARRVVAHQAAARGAPVRVHGRGGKMAAGFSGGPQPQASPVFFASPTRCRPC